MEGLKHESDQSDPMQSDEPFDFDPGYQLAARGRQEAEDERLALLERILTRSLVDGVSWSNRAGGALRSGQAGGRWPSG